MEEIVSSARTVEPAYHSRMTSTCRGVLTCCIHLSFNRFILNSPSLLHSHYVFIILTYIEPLNGCVIGHDDLISHVCVGNIYGQENRQELAPNTPAQVESGSVSPRKRPLSKLRGTTTIAMFSTRTTDWQ